jgi:hypothetical protein
MFTYIHVPVADMREQATETSKVVSQALFGEVVQLGERSGEWALIQTPDQYTGWVRSVALLTRPAYPTHLEVSRLAAHIYHIDDTEYGPLLTLPFGSKLEALDASGPRWIRIRLIDGREAFIQKGDTATEPHDLLSLSKKFLGLPYTWGGRSSFGYDCSGFVQMLYQRLGIQLPRDAKRQVLDPQGKTVTIEEATLGDLIFFGKTENAISHVGMCLNNASFIHTAARVENRPYLRISQFSDLEWSGSPKAANPFRVVRRFVSS